MKFLDEAKIFIQSGHGGAGCVSFRREKFIEFGGPDGGNGGKGGSVFVQCVDNLNTLIDYRYAQHFKAKIGGHGMGRNRTGKNGDDIILKVPCGTQFFEEDKESLICDLMIPGETRLLLKGGDGGFGNDFYKSSTNRAPRRADPGWPGEEKWVWLRLKLIADIGLLGMPNAGKSTFLSVTTRAKAKVADYPFTTLVPQLGILSLFDKEVVIADLPGLIEGAHSGVGLGQRFLGHVERCKVLLHLIDGTSEDVLSAYHIIRSELHEYDKGLLEKPEIIALTKTDALDLLDIEKKIKDLASVSSHIFPISSVSKNGFDLLFTRLAAYFEEKDVW